ncbi:hypothetical protein [Brucella intermedia]|uniref:hypothetical protein n=1 Tax=Brucella intermedia TaxID=94625 RepID=UPI000347F14B|nr:hypothetical protein [Brucella intermedia]
MMTIPFTLAVLLWLRLLAFVLAMGFAYHASRKAREERWAQAAYLMGWAVIGLVVATS